MLVNLPNGIDNITETLERHFILRRFNRDHLNMELAEGSDINRIIGMGKRLNPESGDMQFVNETYPAYFENVVKAFEVYPIFKNFGLTISDAMALPVDQWYRIRKSGRALAEAELKRKAEEESERDRSNNDLFEMLRVILLGRGGEED